ncbi:SWIM zinc finger family protein [Kribbella sp. NPDC048915]|uniref:SWIM zinc finger family protein n=1 Tax=Kribbella sp. NPDC048915 TaxID=3155148 RepID=UPI0033DC3820
MSEARGFPPFAAQRRSTRGRSWWAQAWVQAMEDTSLDAGQLQRGRRFANSGQVGTITVSPGRIAASVHAPEDTYESVVHVDVLTEDEWRRFREQVAARAGHIAALLDGEMPHSLVDAAADAGVTLLPGIGDLDPSCTCDAWELPCQHAAALCYQVAWLLDADPFVLLLLRGRTRELLLDELQVSSAGAVGSEGADAEAGLVGVAVGDVLAGSVRDLPEPPGLPAKVSLDELPVAGIEPPDGLGLEVLQLLALDAARRARALLNALLHGAPEPQVLDEWQDSVRLATDYSSLVPALTESTGRDLSPGIQAWQYGGAAGLDVLEHTWTPDPADLNRARAEVLAADDALHVTTSGNHLTIGGDLQLRLDRQGRWHPYRRTGNTWHPTGPPSADPLTTQLF